MRSLVSARGALAGLLGTTLASAGLVLAAPAALAGPVPDGGACATANVCELWADEGSVTLPGAAPVTVPVWSYSAAAGPATNAVGPTLVVQAGVQVTLRVHNDLAEPTTLALPQVPGWNDRAEIAPGTSHDYLVTFDSPGSYLYEAGSSGPADGARQVAMGLAGAIVVRPAAAAVEPLSLDGTAATRFDDETVLVLSEIDPAFNANPSTFDLRSFAPKYRLINGKAHPDTAPVDTAASHRLLLRTLNVGLLEHSLGALGLRQTIIGLGSHPLTQPYNVFAETAQPGQSIDSLVSIDAAPAPSYPMYETAAGSGVTTLANFGGMLTSITTGATVTPKPTVTGLAVTPLNQQLSAAAIVPTFGLTPGTATAEYQFDGAGGWLPISTGTSLPVVALGNGSHTIAVRAVDGAVTGPASSAVFTLDGAGPVVSALTATPGYSTGTTPLTISATGNETTTGGSNVAAGTFSITGSGLLAPLTGSLTRNQAAPIAALTGTQPLSTLSEGVYTVSVTATDELGNASAVAATTTFTVDRTGPTVTAGSVTVNPALNNGTNEWRTGTGTFLISAEVSDNIEAGGAEGFFNNPSGAVGTGFAMPPTTNAIGPTKTVSVEVPLSELTALPDGTVTVSVRGRDAAGNWGTSLVNGSFQLDRTAPLWRAGTTVSGAPLPAGGVTTSIAVTVDNPTLLPATPLVSDALTGVPVAGGIESFIGADPGRGLATALSLQANGTWTGTIPVSATRPTGSYQLYVRARDGAGNWGPFRTAASQVVVRQNAIFADAFETLPNGFTPWNGSLATGPNARLNSLPAAPADAPMIIAADRSMFVTLTGNAGTGYVTDNSPTPVPTIPDVSYHAQFQLRPVVSTTGTSGAVVATVFRATTGNSGTGNELFRVEYRRLNGPARSQLRLVVTTSTGGTLAGNWVTSATGTSSQAVPLPAATVQIDWTLPTTTQATVVLRVNGIAQPGLTVTSGPARRVVESVSLGRIGGGNNANLGSLVFDSFTSTRFTLP